MTENCECIAAGFCQRRNTRIPQRHFERCSAGEVDLIDRLYAQIANKPEVVVRAPLPVICTVGMRIREEIEGYISQQITCMPCVSYFNYLNTQSEHDVEAITNKLASDLPIPKEIRTAYGDVSVWIREIVQSVIDDHLGV